MMTNRYMTKDELDENGREVANEIHSKWQKEFPNAYPFYVSEPDLKFGYITEHITSKQRSPNENREAFDKLTDEQKLQVLEEFKQWMQYADWIMEELERSGIVNWSYSKDVYTIRIGNDRVLNRGGVGVTRGLTMQEKRSRVWSFVYQHFSI